MINNQMEFWEDVKSKIMNKKCFQKSKIKKIKLVFHKCIKYGLLNGFIITIRNIYVLHQIHGNQWELFKNTA